MNIIIPKKMMINAKCQFPHCGERATHLYYSDEHSIFISLCDDHLSEVVRLEVMEYLVSCPNCGCDFGV